MSFGKRRPAHEPEPMRQTLRSQSLTIITRTSGSDNEGEGGELGTHRTPAWGIAVEKSNPSWDASRARRRSHEQPPENGGLFRGLLQLPGSTPVGRGPGLPSGE